MESSDIQNQQKTKQKDTTSSQHERRQEPRYAVDEEIVAFLDKVPCRVLDFSKNGIGLTAIMNDPLTGEDTTLDILIAQDKVFINDIPCRIVNSNVSNISTEMSVLTTRRFGILFEELDEEHRAQLNTILSRYSIGSA